MSAFEISGGTPLYGSIRLGGAKNASYKIMIASLLSQSESRLLNFSHISDVKMVGEIIKDLGGSVTKRGERTLFINPIGLHNALVDVRFGEASRAAPIFLPALVHRFGKASVPMPGGDKLGTRPLDRQFDALKQMGIYVTYEQNAIVATAEKVTGAHIKFKKNTHTGTETVIMAAVLADGKTVIENAALEPEVDDLITYLNECGARIRRRHNKVIEIEGVKSLHGAIHKIMPDRNEAVTYACAAIATKGDIIVENANPAHLDALLQKIEEVGGGYEVGSYGIRFYYKGPLTAADVVTEPHPGFMTDWQPLWAALLTQCEGTSVIHEAIFPQRLQYMEHLQQMGVKAELFNPEVSNPDRVYNFNLEDDRPEYFHAVRIYGVANLQPITCEVKDLRHGATMVLAAMITPGVSRLTNIAQIDRGYEDLDGRLREMGANIKRVE